MPTPHGSQAHEMFVNCPAAHASEHTCEVVVVRGGDDAVVIATVVAAVVRGVDIAGAAADVLVTDDAAGVLVGPRVLTARVVPGGVTVVRDANDVYPAVVEGVVVGVCVLLPTSVDTAAGDTAVGDTAGVVVADRAVLSGTVAAPSVVSEPTAALVVSEICDAVVSIDDVDVGVA